MRAWPLFSSPAFVLKKSDAALQWLLAAWPHSKIGCGFNLHVPPVCSRLLSRDPPGFLPQSKHTDVRPIACARECQRGRMSVSLHRPCGEPAGCPGCNPAFTPRQLGLCSSTLESLRAGEAVMENRKKRKKKHQWVGNSC